MRDEKVYNPNKSIAERRVGYHVPGFLAYLTEGTITESEFYVSYARKETPTVEAPLWWRSDIPITLGKRERIRALNKQNAVNRNITKQIELTQKQNEQYLQKIKRDAESFKKRFESNDEILKSKLEEMELVARERELNLEREKLAQEAKLKEEEREREEAELLLRNEELLRKRQLILIHKQNEIKDSLDAVSSAIIKENQKKEEIRRRYLELHSENALRAAGDPSLPKPAPIEGFTGSTDSRAVAVKTYEKFDFTNILEFKDVYYKRGTEIGYYLAGVNFSVKRNKTTVVYAENEDKFNFALDILAERIPMDMVISRGIVRYDGKELDARREEGESAIVFFEEIYSAIKKGKSLRNLVDEETIDDYMRPFGLSYRKLPKKITNLSDELVAVVSLAVTFATKAELTVLHGIEKLISEERQQTLCELLSANKSQAAVLLMTSSSTTVRSIMDARVYKI